MATIPGFPTGVTGWNPQVTVQVGAGLRKDPTFSGTGSPCTPDGGCHADGRWGVSELAAKVSLWGRLSCF